MPPRITITLLALLGLAQLACGLEADPLGIRHDSVVNGQPHSGHPAAGELTVGGGLCTATLVGKKTVVTAAHCVSPGYTHTFTVGGTAYKSTKAVRHPDYNSYQITYDIAVVLLQEEPTVAAAVINTTAPSVGLELTIVGYGKTGEWAGDAGVKRMAKSKISEVTPTRIGIPASTSSSMGNICNGDSGGPSYATVNGQEVQVGVHSTKSGACGDGGHDTRVDVFADWITQASGGDVNKPGTSPPPAPPPAPGDTQPPSVTITHPQAGAKVPKQITVTAKVTDNDKVAKVELRVDGKLVASNINGSFPVSLAEGNRTLKVTAQDAAGNIGEALVSVIVEGGTPAPPPQPPDVTPGPDPAPSGSFGAPCVGHADCTSGLCADDLTLGKMYCTQLCDLDLSCPAGAICLEAEGTGDRVCGLEAGNTPSAPGPGIPMTGDQLLGGCSVARGRHASRAGAWPLLLLLLLPLARRRPR